MRQLPPEAALVGNLGTFGATGEQDRVCQRKQGSLRDTGEHNETHSRFDMESVGSDPAAFLAKWDFFFCRRCNLVSRECWIAVLHRGLPGARVTEGGGPGVVVDKVANALPRVTDLPTFGQGILILQPATHIRTCVVIFGANTKKNVTGLES